MTNKFKRLKKERYLAWILEFIIAILLLCCFIFFIIPAVAKMKESLFFHLFYIGSIFLIVSSVYSNYIKKRNQEKCYLTKRAMIKVMEKKNWELPELQIELKRVGIHLVMYANAEYVVRYKEVVLFSRYLETIYSHSKYSYSIKGYLSWEIVCWLYFEFGKASQFISVKKEQDTKGYQEVEQRMKEELEKEMFGK